jgi:hypothetical protein
MIKTMNNYNELNTQKFHCNMMKDMRIHLKRLKERGGLGGKQFIFVNSHNNSFRVVL